MDSRSQSTVTDLIRVSKGSTAAEAASISKMGMLPFAMRLFRKSGAILKLAITRWVISFSYPCTKFRYHYHETNEKMREVQNKDMSLVRS